MGPTKTLPHPSLSLHIPAPHHTLTHSHTHTSHSLNPPPSPTLPQVHLFCSTLVENSLLFGSHSRTEDIASLRTISKEVTALLSAAEVMISQSHNRAQDLEGLKKMSIQRSSNLQLLGSAPMGGAMGKKRGAPPKPPSAPDKEEKVCCVCCACVRVCPLMVEYTQYVYTERDNTSAYVSGVTVRGSFTYCCMQWDSVSISE